MVKENRIVFEVGDIVSVRIECCHCKGAVVQAVKNAAWRPDNCPLCGAVWTLPSDTIAADLLLQAFRDVLRDKTKIKIRLELNGDSVYAEA